jgi:magnesium-transporting ATPase (P-type)
MFYFVCVQHLHLEEERLDFEVDVRRENMRVEIDCSEVLVGDILIIDKGDRAAADGIILYSSGTFDFFSSRFVCVALCSLLFLFVFVFLFS